MHCVLIQQQKTWPPWAIIFMTLWNIKICFAETINPSYLLFKTNNVCEFLEKFFLFFEQFSFEIGWNFKKSSLKSPNDSWGLNDYILILLNIVALQKYFLFKFEKSFTISTFVFIHMYLIFYMVCMMYVCELLCKDSSFNIFCWSCFCEKKIVASCNCCIRKYEISWTYRPVHGDIFHLKIIFT